MSNHSIDPSIDIALYVPNMSKSTQYRYNGEGGGNFSGPLNNAVSNRERRSSQYDIPLPFQLFHLQPVVLLIAHDVVGLVDLQTLHSGIE